MIRDTNSISIRNLLFAFVAFLASATCASAAVAPPRDFKVSFIPKPWEVNVERSYMMLDEEWKFIKGSPAKLSTVINLTDKIANPKKYKLRDGSIRPIGEPCKAPESLTCDDSSWITMRVPFNWYDLGPDMDRFLGTVWYRKTIDMPEKSPGSRAVLHFRAAFYRASVYLNGENIGSHEGGYTPFSFDITDRLKPGKNLLSVKIDNVLTRDDIYVADWWNYGGLHREVFIEFTNETAIEDFFIKPVLSPDLKTATVNFEIKTNGGPTTNATVFIYKLHGENKNLIDSVTVPADADGAKLQWKTTAPKLWSPEQPVLYFAKAILFNNGTPGDGYGDIFGFRTFEVRGTKLFLNNKPVFFRGINRHDEFYRPDFPDGGRVMTEEQRISDFRAIKEMNGNSMRTAHYPNHPDNYYVTDRLGILTIEEAGPIGYEQVFSSVTGEKIKTQLREMVARDRNRPSIVIWSIGNEFGGDKYIDYIRQFSELMRSIDDRPLTFTEVPDRDCRQGYKYVDILSRNEYVGWYGDGLKTTETPERLKAFISSGVKPLLDRYHSEFPDMPVFVMETGAESVCGRHAADPAKAVTRGDEEYQAEVLKHQFDEILKHDYVAGVFPWILSDFKTQKSTGTCQFTPHLNRKGLMCADRTKKLAFFLVRDIYTKIAETYEK